MNARIPAVFALSLLAVVVTLSGCRDKPQALASLQTKTPTATTPAPEPESVEEPPVQVAEDSADEPSPEATDDKQADTDEPAETEERPMVLIATTKGDIKVELYPEDAPETVKNFLALAEEGYYDDLPWHRVVPGFVIQTGSREGESRPTIPDEVNKHKHEPGALSMAKPGPGPGTLSLPDSATTQFYICMCSAEEAAYLNEEFTIFGKVTEGMDVVEKITTDDKVKSIKPIDD